MKRSQIEATALIYIVGAIIVAGIIYFGYKQITTVTKVEKELTLEQLKEKITADVEKTASQLGASRKILYYLPADFNQICFIDLDKKDDLLTKDINKLIKDSIETNATNNAFLLGNRFDAFNSGRIKICDPFFICYNATQQRIDVEMHGTGAITVIGPICPEAINLPPNITIAEPNPKNTIMQRANEYEINLTITAEDPENSNLNIKWIINREEKKSEEITSGSQSSFSQILTPGRYKIIAVATDDFNLSDYRQWNLTIYPLTGAPFFVNYTNISRTTMELLGTDILPAELSVRIKQPIFFEVLAIDPENDKITYSAIGNPFQRGALFDPATRRFLWIPQKSDAPTDEGIKTYEVKFNATAKDGVGETTVTINVIPNQRPIARFTAEPTEGIAPLTVTFDASESSDEDGNIVSYEWDFGDEETIKTTEKTITHTYNPTIDTSYTVTLKVKDNDDDYSEPHTEKITVGIPKLVCGISPLCPITNYAYGTYVIALSSPSNAHGAQISDTLTFPYSTNKICCSSNIPIDNKCDENAAPIVKLSSTENAHAQLPKENGYNTNICLNTTAPRKIECNARENNCNLGEECVLSISGDTNAHLGDCSTYPYSEKICCKITT